MSSYSAYTSSRTGLSQNKYLVIKVRKLVKNLVYLGLTYRRAQLGELH